MPNRIFMRRLLGVLFIIIVLFVCSCAGDKCQYPFSDFSYENLRPLKQSDYIIDNQRVKFYIDSFRLSGRDTNYVDVITNRYYAERQPYLWINRWGISLCADTLFHWLAEVRKAGLPEQRFFLHRIDENLDRMRKRDFDRIHTVSRTLATLEYYLTKSYLRYCCGQRFGFVNPNKLFNHLEKMGDDSLRSHYRTLFGLPVETINKAFLSQAFQAIRGCRLNQFLVSVQPDEASYTALCKELQHDGLTFSQRRLLSINLERCRWRMDFSHDGRFLWINLPTQQLQAFDGNIPIIDMKVCIGSQNNKTPLLAGSIMYLDLNPYWVVPKSIVRKDIVAHAGDTAYFARKHFKIVERKTGASVSPLEATAEMLLGKQYLVRQENGENNSLGRVIFRFPNPLSIYLHDSNNKEAFKRSLRTVSHGCVRVEKPYELAMFLVKDEQGKDANRIRRALGFSESEEHNNGLTTQMNQERCQINPAVPVYIVYYTAFPDAKTGKIQYYPDIYNYDELVWQHLNKQ